MAAFSVPAHCLLTPLLLVFPSLLSGPRVSWDPPTGPHDNLGVSLKALPSITVAL